MLPFLPALLACPVPTAPPMTVIQGSGPDMAWYGDNIDAFDNVESVNDVDSTNDVGFANEGDAANNSE